MATVKGKTSIKIDELIDSIVISGRVTEEGVLLFTTRGGAEIYGGDIPMYEAPPPPDPLIGWPVGSIFINVTSADPATLLGGGTWVRWGKGKVPVSLDETQAEFDTAEETGGEKTHTLADTEIPAHVHGAGTLSAGTSGSSHTHSSGTLVASQRSAVGAGGGAAKGNSTLAGDAAIGGDTGTGGSTHTHPVTGVTSDGPGTGQPHNNLQPYITCYMWKRTA